MRMIDPIRLKQSLAVSAILEDKKTIEQIIDEQPTIEQPEIIRCKDCEDYQTEWETSAGLHYCSIIDTDMPPEGFCSNATRKGEQP